MIDFRIVYDAYNVRGVGKKSQMALSASWPFRYFCPAFFTHFRSSSFVVSSQQLTLALTSLLAKSSSLFPSLKHLIEADASFCKKLKRRFGA